MRKALIAIISDHDDYYRNIELANLFNTLYSSPKTREFLKQFWFVFSGGTFERIFSGKQKRSGKPLLNDKTKKWLKELTIQLPPFELGGVIIMSYLVTTEKCKILWTFQTPNSAHHLVSQNNSLRQMCDFYGVRRLMNRGSIIEWLNYQAKSDHDDNILENDEICAIKLKTDSNSIEAIDAIDSKFKIEPKIPYGYDTSQNAVAFIVRDIHRAEFNKFLRKNKDTLSKFDRILITTTKGKFYDKFKNTKVFPCKPVGQGGLVDIAMEILFGRCNDVVFYDSPIDDTKKRKTKAKADEFNRPFGTVLSEIIAYNYQLIISACKINQNVRVKTNMKQAEEWIAKLEKPSMEIFPDYMNNYSINEIEDILDNPIIQFTVSTGDELRDEEIFNGFMKEILKLLKEHKEIKYKLIVKRGSFEIIFGLILPAVVTAAVTVTVGRVLEKGLSYLTNKKNQISKLHTNEEVCRRLAIYHHEHEKKITYNSIEELYTTDDNELTIIKIKDKDGNIHTYECDKRGNIKHSKSIEKKYETSKPKIEEDKDEIIEI